MLSLDEFKQRISATGFLTWPKTPPVEHFWAFSMPNSQEEIWPHIADTSRLNRELGLAPRTEVEDQGKIHVHTTLMGIPQEWIEDPWLWISGRTLVSTRTYIKGMAKTVHSVLHIEDCGDHREICIYFGWTPKNLLWSAFLKLTGPLLKSKFSAAFKKLQAHLSQGKIQITPFVQKAAEMDEDHKQVLEKHNEALKKRNLKPELVDRLCEYIQVTDDLELESIRVLRLAKAWNVDPEELLNVCLHASSIGLLKISWKVICPHCRGSRKSAETLGDIPEAASCTTCDVEFTTEAEDAIEIVFHVHPSVREVQELLFCAAEPAKKNHIKIQQKIDPHQEFKIQMSLKEGLYRARFVGSPHLFKIEVSPQSSLDKIDLRDVKNTNILKVRPEFQVTTLNPESQPVLFVIEDISQEIDLLKPVHLLSNPEFRDLFSKEHLSSNVKLSLGEQTILFTDIVGSTVFYRKVGDAKAFLEVRNHFQEVFTEVKKQKGVVVKTIGDAVMAAFPSPTRAQHAAVEILKRFPESRQDTAIRLRVSVHTGPVIAVHLNTGIDYFGNTINYAAKMQVHADASEIAMTKELFENFKKNHESKTKFDFEECPDSIYSVKVLG